MSVKEAKIMTAEASGPVHRGPRNGSPSNGNSRKVRTPDRRLTKNIGIIPGITQTATGPRTPKGKARSKYNALKHGFSSKVLLLEDECVSEYKSLFDGLREDWQPQGMQEMVLVEQLATLFWRRRRVLRAETAQIAERSEFYAIDYLESLQVEAKNLERDGETSGGMLRNRRNPFVLRKAIEILTTVRRHLEMLGFQNNDPWRLRKIYGLDPAEKAPLGLFHDFVLSRNLALKFPQTMNREGLKKLVLARIDHEMEELKGQEQLFLDQEDARALYEMASAAVLPQEIMDRILRYETHFSREIQRTTSDLERLQRRRLGQPGPPSISLEVS